MTRTVRPGATLALVCIATFMLLLDMTIVASALATIQKDLGASLSSLQWVVDAYTLPVAGLLLTSATMGDRLGRRRLYLLGMAIFTAASLAATLAPNMAVLNGVRAVQGLGAVLLFGVGLPLIANAFPDLRKRAGAIGAFGATLAAATAVGPLIGGALVDGPGWRWIFLINVPVGVVALIGGWRFLSESRAAVARTADWPGTVLLSAALLTLVFGLIRSSTDGWGSALVIGLLAGSVVLVAAFVVRELRTSAPMLDLSLLRRPSFVGPALLALVTAGTLVAATNYIALYLINTLGYTPFQAGLRFLPLSLASFVAAPLAARFGGRLPARFAMPFSGLLVTVGLFTMTDLTGSSSWTHLFLGFVLGGAGLGMSAALVSSAALAAVPAPQAGMATGTVNTFRQIGTAAGIAALGSIFANQASSSMTSGLAGLGLPGTATAQLADAVSSGAGVQVASRVPAALATAVADAARDATAHALNEVFLIGAIVAAVITVLSFVLMQLDARRGVTSEMSAEERALEAVAV